LAQVPSAFNQCDITYHGSAPTSKQGTTVGQAGGQAGGSAGGGSAGGQAGGQAGGGPAWWGPAGGQAGGPANRGGGLACRGGGLAWGAAAARLGESGKPGCAGGLVCASRCAMADAEIHGVVFAETVAGAATAIWLPASAFARGSATIPRAGEAAAWVVWSPDPRAEVCALAAVNDGTFLSKLPVSLTLRLNESNDF